MERNSNSIKRLSERFFVALIALSFTLFSCGPSTEQKKDLSEKKIEIENLRKRLTEKEFASLEIPENPKATEKDLEDLSAKINKGKGLAASNSLERNGVDDDKITSKLEILSPKVNSKSTMYELEMTIDKYLLNPHLAQSSLFSDYQPGNPKQEADKKTKLASNIMKALKKAGKEGDSLYQRLNSFKNSNEDLRVAFMLYELKFADQTFIKLNSTKQSIKNELEANTKLYTEGIKYGEYLYKFVKNNDLTKVELEKLKETFKKAERIFDGPKNDFSSPKSFGVGKFSPQSYGSLERRISTRKKYFAALTSIAEEKINNMPAKKAKK